MTQEEKAKAYDELKVKAQELEEDGCFDKLTLFDLFPELQEDEDEKIRKGLIHTFSIFYKDEPDAEWDGKPVKDIIAWLEKQGEHQNRFKPSEEMLEALYKVIPGNVMAISEDEMFLDKLYQGLKYGRVLKNKK